MFGLKFSCAWPLSRPGSAPNVEAFLRNIDPSFAARLLRLQQQEPSRNSACKGGEDTSSTKTRVTGRRGGVQVRSPTRESMSARRPSIRSSASFKCALLATGTWLAAAAEVQAQTSAPAAAIRVDAVPPFTVGVLTGGPAERGTIIAKQLQTMLESGMEIGPNGERGLVVRPVSATEGRSAVVDLLQRPGVDLAVIPLNVLEHTRKEDLLGDVTKKLVYIMRLPPEDVVVLSRRADIKSVFDLAGKLVSVGPAQDDVALQARAIFGVLGIGVTFDNRKFEDAIGATQMDEIAAVVTVVGDPERTFARSPGSRETAARRLHAVSIPFDKLADAPLLPATLTHDKYPDLVAGGASVDTVAVSSALLAVDWPKWNPRYALLKVLTETVLQRFDELRSSELDKRWREINLGATLPGWRRFGPAEVWLEQHGRSGTRPGTSPRG